MGNKKVTIGEIRDALKSLESDPDIQEVLAGKRTATVEERSVLKVIAAMREDIDATLASIPVPASDFGKKEPEFKTEESVIHAFEDKLPELLYSVPETLKYMRLMKVAGETGNPKKVEAIKAKLIEYIGSREDFSPDDKETLCKAVGGISAESYRFNERVEKVRSEIHLAPSSDLKNNESELKTQESVNQGLKNMDEGLKYLYEGEGMTWNDFTDYTILTALFIFTMIGAWHMGGFYAFVLASFDCTVLEIALWLYHRRDRDED